MFYFIPKQVMCIYLYKYCFIHIGSKSSNFMVDAGSYAPSVLLPNAWFSLEPRLLLGRRWNKNQAVLGFPRAEMLKTWNCHWPLNQRVIFEAICLANYLHLPPFSVERRYTGVIFLPGCWFGFLPSTIFWVNFMSLLDLCVSLANAIYRTNDMFGNVRIPKRSSWSPETHFLEM